ncbi:sensor histidine kinase [[Clostridium] polysaccharolyticum]|uniref:Two-component system, sensor histidine kinase YesM n=1 Tax=[Clostridium] polysaccharolyticum TaxID=29364 RepID=A0A1H9ZPG3_9FIRM|nr:histidine kinase [[Clostridium] polysaccharolyticum]SES83576.1 two-component system, sensor histidine kinase YesM [[Clostridium] polysaccharolyticum]
MSRLKQMNDVFSCFTKNMKLKQKFVMLYLIAIVIPVIVVDSIVLINIKAYQVREAKIQMENSVERTLNEFSGVIEQVSYLSRNIVNDPLLTEFLNMDYTSEEEYRMFYEDIKDKSILDYYKFIKEISNITIYVENDTIEENSHIKQLDDVERKNWWYQNYKRQKSNVYFFEDISRNAGSAINPHAGTISLARKISLANGREAVLLLDLNYNQINHSILREQTKSSLYICNRSRIVFASNSKIFKDNENRYPVVEQIHREKIVLSKRVPLAGEEWKIYAVSSQETFLNTLFSSKELVFIMLCINLLLPVLAINSVVKSIIRRLNVLDEHFEGLNSEQLEKIEEDSFTDEISQLICHYNGCVDKIQALIDTIVEKNDEKHALEATKKQAELNALNTQVNPHFMYNTLECICMRSLLKGEKETADIVRCLSVLLRQMSKWDKDVVSIKDELAFVEKYLIIQKYRFAEKIAYEVKVEDSAKDFMIPKLTLVSFVENACVHGIEESLESGDVSVTAHGKENKVIIIVKDTGCGMDEDTLDKLRKKIEVVDVNMLYRSKSTGVLNAVMRLRMHFGDRLNFTITSVVDEGTRIEICIERESQENRGM